MGCGACRVCMPFADLYDGQSDNQDKLIAAGSYDDYAKTEIEVEDGTRRIVPFDDVGLASYHVQQLISEVGEVLEADKRWKNFRNEQYDKQAKAEEIADCFIVLMNVAMFSGMSAEDVYKAVDSKIKKVSERIDESIGE